MTIILSFRGRKNRSPRHLTNSSRSLLCLWLGRNEELNNSSTVAIRSDRLTPGSYHSSLLVGPLRWSTCVDIITPCRGYNTRKLMTKRDNTNANRRTSIPGQARLGSLAPFFNPSKSTCSQPPGKEWKWTYFSVLAWSQTFALAKVTAELGTVKCFPESDCWIPWYVGLYIVESNYSEFDRVFDRISVLISAART